MKRTFVMALVAPLLLVAVSATSSAQGRPDFSGTWTFNPQLIPVSNRELAPLTTLIVKQTSAEISFEGRAFQQEQTPIVFRLDGSESVNNTEVGTTKGTAAWQGATLVITASRTFSSPLGDVTFDFKEAYSLADGALILERTETQGGKSLAFRPGSYKVAFTKGPYRQPPMPPNASTTPGPDGSCPRDAVLFRACAMEKFKTYKPRRGPDGKPDFEGYWQIAGALTGATPAQGIEAQPPNALWGGGRSMVVDPPDGTIPYQGWANKDREWRMRGQNAVLDTLVVSCLGGMPRTYTYAMNHWMRTKDAFVVTYEMHHEHRVIAMDGRPPLTANIGGLWRGSSRGRWEGDTLLVETNQFNGKTYVDMQFVPQSDATRLVERFMLIDDNLLYFEATIIDPRLYTRPWTMNGALRRNVQPRFEILESACHEDNREISAEGVLRSSDFERIRREAETRPHLR